MNRTCSRLPAISSATRSAPGCVRPSSSGLGRVRAQHLRGDDDELVRVRPMLDLIPDWASYLADADADPNPGPDHRADHFHRHARTGRPLGSDAFIDALETRLGRALRPQKPGPKPKSADARTRDLFSGFSDE